MAANFCEIQECDVDLSCHIDDGISLLSFQIAQCKDEAIPSHVAKFQSYFRPERERSLPYLVN